MNEASEADAEGRYEGLPEWVGMFASGRGDLAERHEEIIRESLADAPSPTVLSEPIRTESDDHE